MPAGRPKRCQLVFTASMSWRTRSSRATMPMISSLPPCELTKTSLRTPARATEAPSSVQASISVAAGSVSVPGACRCSFDLPTAWTGRMRMSRSSGRRAITVVQHALHDRGVGRHRQMRPVLLDRRHRQHGDRRLRVDRGIFGGAVVAPPDASPVMSCLADRSSRRAPGSDHLDLDLEFRPGEAGDDHQRRGRRRARQTAGRARPYRAADARGR